MHSMQDPHVETLDLRSIRFLARLLETGSVTRAGEACGLSQPSASRVLARLRDVLGDPLLVRGQQGHVLTSRAESLREGVQEALAAMGFVFTRDGFDPAATDRVFHVAASEYTMCTGAGALLQAVLAQAPRARVHFEQIGSATLDALESGRIDLPSWDMSRQSRSARSPWATSTSWGSLTGLIPWRGMRLRSR
jgi:DNA-binding transcriptional LysR family regulator